MAQFLDSTPTPPREETSPKDTSPDIIGKLRGMIQEISRDEDYDVEKIEDGFIMDIPVLYKSEECESDTCEEVRRQFVYITANRKSGDGEDMYQVFTICAPEDERFYKSALLLNMNLPFGAIAISQVEGKSYFVLVDTYLVSDVSTKEMELSILSLAKAGDRIEKILVGDDLS